jgi:hypothetical protein
MRATSQEKVLDATTVPDDDEELTRVLGDAIRSATAELPDGYDFGCESVDGR